MYRYLRYNYLGDRLFFKRKLCLDLYGYIITWFVRKVLLDNDSNEFFVPIYKYIAKTCYAF